MSRRFTSQQPELSSPQREVWFGQLVHPDAPVYVIGGYVCLEGAIDPARFERAVDLTVQRHDALRVVLHEAQPLPVVDYRQRMAIPVEHVDLSGDADPEQAALDWLTKTFRTPFAPYDRPLVQYALVKVSPRRWRWLLKYQHVVADGWSIALVVQDVARAYRCLAEGRLPDWEPAPSYLEFVHDDLDYARSEAYRRDGEYWADKFPQVPPALIPRRHEPEAGARTAPSGFSRLVLARDFYDRLEQLAGECRASLVHVLLAALYTCFTRTSGRDELVVGMLSLNRRTAAFKRTVGMFTKLMPARFAFGTDLPARELVQAIAAELRRDYRHQRYPVAEITRRAGLPQGGRRQLFDITLSYEKHSHDAEFDGRPARTIGLSNGYEQNALALFVRDLHADGDVHLDLHYSLSAFEPPEIELFKSRFVFVLEQMLQDAGRAVRDLDVMPPAEVDRVLRGANDSRRDVPRDDTIVDVLERQVQRSAGVVALRAGRVALDYAELNRRANRLARHLRAQGIGIGCLVALCLDRSEDLVIATLAVLKTGAAFLPLDPAYPAARRAMTVADARPSLVVTHHGLWPENAEGIRTLALDEEAPPIADRNGEDLHRPIPAAALAYVNYTSGSTGRPKGVMVSHGNVVNLFAAMDDCLGAQPATWLALTSVSFDISVLELLWTLSRGSTVVLGAGALDVAAPAPARGRRARPLDLSLFYFATDEGSEREDKYRLLLDGARLADEKGFAAVWTPERHFHAFGGLYPNPSVTAAAVAAVTRRVHVRAGSVVLPLHHPVRVAEEWAVVDNLSGGRVGISFASGWQERDFVLAPDRYADRKQGLARDIDLVRRLWRGETVSLPGPDGRAVDVRTLPRPVQAELPVWITAAGDPATFDLAGTLGANVLTHLLGQSTADLARKIAIYRDSYRRQSGGRDGHVTLMLHAFAGRSRAAVRDAVRAPFRRYLKSSVSLMANVAQGLGVDMASERFRDEDMEALLDHAFERYVETSALFGTPDECRDTLDRLAGIGVDEVALLIDFGVPHDAAMESLERLAELVNDRAGSPVGGDSFAELVRRHEVTHLQCTPSMARLLMAQPAAREALRSLDCLVLGGEELTLPLAQSLHEALPARLFNMYGPTETTVWSTCHPMAPMTPATMPIGRPVANTQVYLLDGRMNPVPVGVTGELYIGGRGVSHGYLGQPDRTAERFVPDPFGAEPGGRLYRTGDLAWLRPDGRFAFAGRADDQLKIRGHRVEPGEVESVLLEHPSIAHAVVVATPERDGERRLVAYLVPQAGRAPGLQELRRFAETRLPAAFVPSTWIVRDTLPLTPNGKVDRRALERAAMEVPEAAPAPASVAGPEEEMLAEVWTELLGRRPAGPRDNFFESGGHSLLAMLLAQRVRGLFGVEVSLRQLFNEPTLGGLAAYIRAV
ncbi:MAG TPA: MupA/Atu3671 family FMN-dependent luciferase-like monooxygenase, partial [Vicinamibacterales bacterium]|nr:MupA/Atu3671 family FMN-dependent luciferase-like monooxygenase [Vicinamibacterales bacterium]